MRLFNFSVGPFAENTYLLTNDNEALLIDPGFSNSEEYTQAKEKIKAEEADLLAVVLTHAHVDHVLGLSKVLADFDIPVYLCDKDLYLWKNYASQAAMFGLRVDDFTFVPEPLEIQPDWSVGSFSFDILYTPGHSPDHVSLYNKQEELLIAGDTLFKEGIGRTDLYKGDMHTLKNSIKEQLYVLPGHTTVYPGHGPQTTINHEQKANPFVTLGE